MGDRDWISRVAAVLAVLFVVAGYGVPWVHMVMPPPGWAARVPSGGSPLCLEIDAIGNVHRSLMAQPGYRIHFFIWGISADIPAPPSIRLNGDSSQQFTALWFQSESFLRWFVPGSEYILIEYIFIATFLCYLLAGTALLLGLSEERKKARLVGVGLLLASLILFFSATEWAIIALNRDPTGERWFSYLITSWDAGPYLCVISLILTALSRVTQFSASDVGHALVEMLRSERVQ